MRQNRNPKFLLRCKPRGTRRQRHPT